jgi:hypothetical protein
LKLPLGESFERTDGTAEVVGPHWLILETAITAHIHLDNDIYITSYRQQRDEADPVPM